jgi:long-chain acyl-CoA synthetase
LVAALRTAGVQVGDVVATLLPNSVEALTVLLATSEAGFYLVPINYHLVAPEVGYILADCGARAFIAHERFADVAGKALSEGGVRDDLARVSVGSIDGFTPWSSFVADQSAALPADRTAGALMTYTSGTTGRPKGVSRPLSGADPHAAAEMGTFLVQLFGIPPLGDGVHLVTAPLYHTAVSNFTMAAFNAGHSVVLMDQWSPEGTLERIARYRVTNTHMVPTMFNRLLKLPEDVRASADVSSMTHAIHSAAPCPVPTKRAMLDWWGPVIYEYYAATEGGGTIATPQDWEKKPGTVGSAWPISEVVVFDDDGNRQPPGEIGTVYMRMGQHTFSYHGDEEKTKKSWRDGYFTVGDAGYLDEDGFLFLCDRKADMIISGGVNIYPAEIESVLSQHPDVDDVAVFGVPHEDWGEEVKAAIQPVPGAPTDAAQERRILEYAQAQLAKFKCPRSIDFVHEFPRDPNGKVYKRRLRDPYWVGRERQI